MALSSFILSLSLVLPAASVAQQPMDRIFCQSDQINALVGHLDYEIVPLESKWMLLVKPEGSQTVFDLVTLLPHHKQDLIESFQGESYSGVFRLAFVDGKIYFQAGDSKPTCQWVTKKI